MKYSVLSEGGLSAGTTLAYLLANTSLHVDTIFMEARPQASLSQVAVQKSPTDKRNRLWLHARLACVQRRKYLFQVCERIAGCSQSDLLARWGTSSWIVRLLCGFSIPPSLRGKVRLVTLHEVAKWYQIPVVTLSDFHDPNALDKIRAAQPDVLLGLGTRILKRELLQIPTLGSLNGHASLLPEFRGGVTEFWQLVYGQSRTGVTIHWMVPDVDAGDICAQGSWPIPRGFDHHKLRMLSMFLRLEPWRQVIAELESGRVPRIPQGDSQTPVFRKPTLQMEYDFYCRGIRVTPRVSGSPQATGPSQAHAAGHSR